MPTAVKWQTCFKLDGGTVPEEKMIPVQGYRGEQPVRMGNNAATQLQLSNYGDLIDTAVLFIDAGHVLDLETSRLIRAVSQSLRRQVASAGLRYLGIAGATAIYPV